MPTHSAPPQADRNATTPMGENFFSGQVTSASAGVSIGYRHLLRRGHTSPLACLAQTIAMTNPLAAQAHTIDGQPGERNLQAEPEKP